MVLNVAELLFLGWKRDPYVTSGSSATSYFEKYSTTEVDAQVSMVMLTLLRASCETTWKTSMAFPGTGKATELKPQDSSS